MNDCFIFYDDEKNVKVVSSDLESYKHYNFFKIDEKSANDFLSGKKLLEEYFIKFNNLNIPSLEKKYSVNFKNVYSDAVKAKKNYDQGDLIIEYSNLKKQYTLSLSNQIKDAISNAEYEKVLKLYVVKSDQVNWILNVLEVKISDLINKKIEFSFKTSHETSFDNIEIFTRRYFENIGMIQ